MPASKFRICSYATAGLLLTVTLLSGISVSKPVTGTTGTSVPVSLLINYGNGALEWHNNTLVPSTWNFYNVTTYVTNGDVSAIFFASFGSHFVYLINGVGCPTIFGCDMAWSFWVLNNTCWELPSVGVDQVPVSSGITAAWFLVPLSTFGENPPTGQNCAQISIDVKPGSVNSPPPINVRSQGLIPVAILSTLSFNASTVDPSTVRFGATGTEAAPVNAPSLEDVDGDGTLDLVLHFRTQDTGFVAGDTQAVLTGRTFNRTPLIGTSTIKAFFPGDVNGDGKVDILDLALVARSYGSTKGGQYWNQNADLDDDGVINIIDLAMVASYFGQRA